jgi:carboxyl-terminal processing protease
MQIYDRYDSGEMDSADKIEVNDSLRFVTPKGKVVYGGGGIIPDVFVGVESTTLETLKMLDEETYISNFVFNYLERNRKKYYNFTRQEFLRDFNFTQNEVRSFIDDLKSYGFVLDQKQYGQIINTLMKANMADQLFDANIGAQLRGTLDPMLEKVLEIEKTQ